MSAADARLLELLAPVADGLGRMRTCIEAELCSESPTVSDMTDHIARFRGKQLRGALVLLVGEACGRTTDEHAAVAAIVELIHLATLVHDDVLDGAKVRRRVACVHARWDNQMAVLLGDFLYARAFALSTRLGSRLASQVLALTTQRICAGEIDQAASRYDFEMSEAGYERIAGAKTAALYSAASELGASYPAGPDVWGTEFGRFGWELGLAFQIVDDCLDVLGQEEVVGKSVGTDVADGKVTLPVLHVYREADERTRARIRDVYTLPELEGRAQRLREVCDLAPGVEYALQRARDLVQRARQRISSLPDTSAKRALVAVGDYILERHW